MRDDGQQRDWEAIRRDVEAGGRTYTAICRQHRISRGELQRRIKANHWHAPETDDLAVRRILVDGIYWALERMIERMAEAEPGLDPAIEAAVLHRLATTLGKLIAIDRLSAGRKLTAQESREIAVLKARVIGRLDELGID